MAAIFNPRADTWFRMALVALVCLPPVAIAGLMLLARSPLGTSQFEMLTQPVQFDHRLIAWVLIVVVPLMWFAVRRRPVPRTARLASNFLLAALALQVSLGIATLLLRVPVVLGAAHQGGAVLVFAAALWLAHELRRPSAVRTGELPAEAVASMR